MNVDNPNDWEPSNAEDDTLLVSHIADEPRRMPNNKETTMMCFVDQSSVHEMAVHWC
jgi:hypothetical protein